MDIDDAPDSAHTPARPEDGAANTAGEDRAELLEPEWQGPGLVDEEFEDVGTDADS